MVIGSIYYSKDREKRKELDGIMSETKKKEKHEKWLRELEARDEEDKEMRARLLAGKAAQTGQRTTVEEPGSQRPGVLQSVQDMVNSKR